MAHAAIRAATIIASQAFIIVSRRRPPLHSVGAEKLTRPHVASKGNRAGESPAKRRSFDSCAGDLLRHRGSLPTEDRAFTQAPHRGFIVTLSYVEPGTNTVRRVSELSDSALVEKAVRLASEQAPTGQPGTGMEAGS